MSAGAAAAQEQTRFISLEIDTYASGISADGSIVVRHYLPPGNSYPPEEGRGGCYWTADSGTVNIGGNGVAGISADGTTIVGRANDPMGRENAAIWQGGTDWQLLGSFTPDAAPCDQFLSAAYAVNGDG